MGWGSSGGGGVGTGVGSPEAERGRRSLDGDGGSDGGGPHSSDPRRRPGCLVTLAAIVVLAIGLIAVLWLIGEFATWTA
jgi:hypothetical protein